MTQDYDDSGQIKLTAFGTTCAVQVIASALNETSLSVALRCDNGCESSVKAEEDKQRKGHGGNGKASKE